MSHLIMKWRHYGKYLFAELDNETCFFAYFQDFKSVILNFKSMNLFIYMYGLIRVA